MDKPGKKRPHEEASSSGTGRTASAKPKAKLGRPLQHGEDAVTSEKSRVQKGGATKIYLLEFFEEWLSYREAFRVHTGKAKITNGAFARHLLEDHIQR